MSSHFNSFLMVCFFMSASAIAADNSSSSSLKCPALKLEDIKQLNAHKDLKIDGHKWYLTDNYRVTHNALGTDRPSLLTIEDINKAQSIEFSKSIGERQCLYAINIPSKNITGFLLFSLMGEPHPNQG